MTAATPGSAISTAAIFRPEGEPRRAARVEIDAAAAAENWRRVAREAVGAETAAAVKADAYGCGADLIAPALAQAGCRTFFVASLGEALRLRHLLGRGPRIMALNGVQAGETAALLGAEIVPVLNTLAQVALWRAAAPGAPAAVHIDTGMNRLGLPLDAVGAAAEALGDQKLALVMSHLACGEDPAHPLNERQRARFQVAQEAFGPAQRSLAASAGAFMGERYRYDLVRPGLALYGGDPFAAPGPELLAVARITAPILQVRDVAAGESFGYGATAVAEAPMRTATVAIGYADGFLRAAAGRGYGVLAGVRMPILGRVSMDLLILDARDAPQAEVGMLVEVLGEQARLADVARAFDTAPYEVLTSFVGAARRGAA